VISALKLTTGNPVLARPIDLIMRLTLSQALLIGCLRSPSQEQVSKRKIIANSSHYAIQSKRRGLKVEASEGCKLKSQKKAITRSQILM
jgi:hypothetical protein